MQKNQMMYSKLIIMVILSFISMYILMYMMVDKFQNVYPNFNQFYMAGMMTMPMIIIELFLMSSMYSNKIVNFSIIILSVFLLALFIFFTRTQTAISDKEFLKSMIPHHGGAILMCKNASIQDQEIKKLCQSIIGSQQSEIDWMQDKLNKLKQP